MRAAAAMRLLFISLAFVAWLIPVPAHSQTWQFKGQTDEFGETTFYAFVGAQDWAFYVRREKGGHIPDILYITGDSYICGFSGQYQNYVQVTWRVDKGPVYTGDWSISDDSKAVFYREKHWPGTKNYGPVEAEIIWVKFLEMLKSGNVLQIKTYDSCGQETRRTVPLAGSGKAITSMLERSRF